MVLADTPRLTVSRELYLAIIRENPNLPIERRRDGTLIVMPATGSDASRRNAEITVQLGTWNRGRGGVVFDSSGGFDLPDGSTLSPDAAWVPRSRWSGLTEEERRRFSPLCPDFVVELLSPSDNLNEARDKLADFIRNGAQLGWLIDPFRKAVEIYRTGREPEIRENPRSVDGEGILPGFVLDLTAVFDE